jgi:hypothetical protein
MEAGEKVEMVRVLHMDFQLSPSTARAFLLGL